MFVAAYALARLGKPVEGGRDAPPAFLKVTRWQEAYDLFYPGLNGGRALASFRSSLKNARDAFDAYLASRRTGWRAKDGTPPEPRGSIKAVLERWKDRSDLELSQEIERILAQAPATAAPGAADWAAVRKRIVQTTLQTVGQSGKKQVRMLKNKELRCKDLAATIDELLFAQNYACARTGVSFSEAHPDLRASLDRVDSDGHYSDGTMEDGVHNLQLVTHWYNMAKSTRTDAAMMELLRVHAQQEFALGG